MKNFAFSILFIIFLKIISICQASTCTSPIQNEYFGKELNSSFYCAWDITTYDVSNYTLDHHVVLHNGK